MVPIFCKNAFLKNKERKVRKAGFICETSSPMNYERRLGVFSNLKKAGFRCIKRKFLNAHHVVGLVGALSFIPLD